MSLLRVLAITLCYNYFEAGLIPAHAPLLSLKAPSQTDISVVRTDTSVWTTDISGQLRLLTRQGILRWSICSGRMTLASVQVGVVYLVRNIVQHSRKN